MQRVIIALAGVACAFAALAVLLNLQRTMGSAVLLAGGIFAGVMAIGYPLLYLYCKRRWWEMWRFALLGMLIGAACAVPFGGGRFSFGFLLLTFVLAGAIFGQLLWLGAIWRNDDLTCPKSLCLPCGTAYKVARNALTRYSK